MEISDITILNLVDLNRSELNNSENQETNLDDWFRNHLGPYQIQTIYDYDNYGDNNLESFGSVHLIFPWDKSSYPLRSKIIFPEIIKNTDPEFEKRLNSTGFFFTPLENQFDNEEFNVTSV